MKKISAYLVALIGVAAIIFGVLFLMGAGDSQDVLAGELAPVTISQVDATYDQVSAGVKANPQDVSLALKKASLGLAKSNLGLIDFVRKSSYLTIAMGVGMVLIGLSMAMMKEK